MKIENENKQYTSGFNCMDGKDHFAVLCELLPADSTIS